MTGCNAGAPSRTGARTLGVRRDDVRPVRVRRDGVRVLRLRSGNPPALAARRGREPELAARRGREPELAARRGSRRFAAAVTCLLLLAGCGGEPEFEWPEDPVAAPMPTLDAGEAAAADELLVAFDEFRRTEIAVHADPQPPDVALERLRPHLADPLLSDAVFEVDTLLRRGLVRQGEPSWQATVTALDLAGEPPTATVRECVDSRGWQVVTSAGGAAPTDGLPQRYAMDTYVREYDAMLFDGGWLFEEARMEVGEPC